MIIYSELEVNEKKNVKEANLEKKIRVLPIIMFIYSNYCASMQETWDEQTIDDFFPCFYYYYILYLRI